MDQINVGMYELGYENVELYLREGHGGEFYLNPEKALPQIKLGGFHITWEDLYTALLHETIEFALTREGHRYIGSRYLGNDSGAFLFWFNHSEFSDVCAKAAEFITLAEKDLRIAWLKFKIKHKIKPDDMVKVT